MSPQDRADNRGVAEGEAGFKWDRGLSRGDPFQYKGLVYIITANYNFSMQYFRQAEIVVKP